jgi:Tetracyclin repressor-like, C-terminal domain
VTILVGRVRDAVARHPEVVPLLLARRHASVGTRRWGEAVLGALAEGGFDDTKRVVAFRTILSYVLGAVQVQHLGALSGPATAVLAEQPIEQFPLLAATATVARKVSPDDEFRLGLAAVLRGISSGAPA